MSNASAVGMTPWVSLAVQAVGPTGDRPYDAWLAEVERTAVDLWLMSAPGGSTALQAEALSSCLPVAGVLTQAHVDGGQGRARLVLRVPDGEGDDSREHTFLTEGLAHRRARDVLERAQSLIGKGVRLLLTAGGSGEQRVLHISDSGERERNGGPWSEQGATTASVQQATAPVQEHQRPAAPTPAPVAPVAPASPPAPVETPTPPTAGGVTWEEGSVSVWRNIDRSWPKEYRTSCLLSLRERVRVDDRGLVINLDQLIDLAHQLPDPDTPRGKDIAARHPA
ncbi:hypothetical protein ACH4F6_21635 [Streptomyces sp. NPDC017936]|uniref:hypothetical protein n=1 Tax=Streptomyces sp. NPDC017936 TaxID=3365016 RepID=UPI00378FB348